jgi:uroporphyrin-III C-methyltransferase/precorrin-2 dehydrogenase/sirohydrochlorin ferrochelatase
MTSRYLPIALDVKDSACLVVGGGQVALRKVEWLRSAGASVEVIAKRACAELWERAESYALSLDERAFEDTDLERKRYTLVIAATSDRELNARVSKLARAHGIPVNVVDAPELCTFIVPALVDRAPITIGISTEGSSPVLARLVRRRIESVLPAELGALARFAAAHRQAVKDALPDAAARRAFWERVLESTVADDVMAGDAQRAADGFTRALEEARDASAGQASTPFVVELVIWPDVGLDALTLSGMRALGCADVVLYELATYPAVRHFARRDAVQRVVEDGDVAALDKVRETTPSAHRICIVCEEITAERWIGALTGEGSALSR